MDEEINAIRPVFKAAKVIQDPGEDLKKRHVKSLKNLCIERITAYKSVSIFFYLLSSDYQF